MNGLYHEKVNDPIVQAHLRRSKLLAASSTEEMADAALLSLSKLRDWLMIENANIPACRVDEAMEITLAAVRSALGIKGGSQ